MSEIKSVYKVGDMEFETEEEANAYLEQLQKSELAEEEKETARLAKYNDILDLEKQLYDLYCDYENTYGHLNGRSNNIKELLRLQSTN